jgi:branched-chain amino acid transport system substrate-binding protein
VKDGQQKAQYVYRMFPSTNVFARRGIQMMVDIFKEAKVSPKRVVLMHSVDAFGKPQADSFVAAQKAMNPGFDIVEVIPWPETATDLSTEVSRAKAAKPDIIAPITRPATAILLLQELAKQRVELLGVISPGAPGLYESGQIAQLKELIEYVMDNVPWPNFKNPRTQKAADEYAKRSGGKSFDTNSGYSYETVLIMADVLERAHSTEPDALVDAIKQTSFKDPLMVSAGPVAFNDVGDNANAGTAMVQILGGKPLVVYPPDAAQRKFVFPKPKR